MALSVACQPTKSKILDEIIPAPQKIEVRKGSLKLNGMAVKCDPAVGEDAFKAISNFADKVNATGGKLGSVSYSEGDTSNGIVFLKDENLPAENYTIEISKKTALVKASDFNGFFYSLQTMLQMLPPAVYGNVSMPGEDWSLPCCLIEDGPRFGYRGMHLDCSRHFWSVEEVKKYLDVMAYFKLNRFHWHLTDDQGWRIEILKYPLLTKVAAFREGTQIGYDKSSSDHIPHGGFYSQEEVKDIIAYAAERGITIIPEIDLPGHMLGALSAYPWLGCTGGPYTIWTHWGISSEVLCAGKESSFKFLEDVLGEIADLFPGEYIHIGGDECPKSEWEKCPDCQALIKKLGFKDQGRFSAEQFLQNYVTKRVQDYLATKGKKIIGWDEILEGELAPGATVMSWRGAQGGQQAAAKGFDAIMTPNTHFYFDYRQEEDPPYLSAKKLLPISTVYSFDPYKGIEPENYKHILGIQANLWVEYVAENEHLEYMLLPRMLALCECQWCPQEQKDYQRFKAAVVNHEFKVFDAAGYSYAKLIAEE